MLSPTLVQNFLAVYAGLNAATIDAVDALYADDVIFIDPVRRVEGLAMLKRYLRHTYENVESVGFTYSEPALAGDEAFLRWNMHFLHPRLDGGRKIVVAGASFIRGGDKIIFHEDYYDMGALLYERVPVVGAVVRFLKRRLQQP